MYKPEICPDKIIQSYIDKLPKLDPETKKIWVDALLSGEYKQGKDRLKNPKKGSYCCLGVAVDVAVKSGGLADQEFTWTYGEFRSNTYDETYLPTMVQKWLGTNKNDLKVYYKGKPRTLASLNDDGVEFEIIAGLIINQL